MPTTLITGGGGFLGVRLAARLQAQGEQVVLFDRHFAPAALAMLAAGYEALEGDVTDADRVRQVVATVRPAGIVHLAAILSGQSEVDPSLAFAVNVAGTFHVLEAARGAGVRRVLAASSGAVLEAPHPSPPLDETTTLAPLSVYGMTKTAVEAWCQFYLRRFGLDTRVARPAAVVGPGRVARGAASFWTIVLIEEPLLGHPYACPVGEDDALPLVYHTDLIEGLMRLYGADRVPSPVYNLGACSASAGELARLVREIVPEARIRFERDPIACLVVSRLRHSVLDSGRAGRELGWQPRYPQPADLVAACAAELRPAGAGGATWG
jgi:nucleoside-diphosphate-sugar epimerase